MGADEYDKIGGGGLDGMILPMLVAAAACLAALYVRTHAVSTEALVALVAQNHILQAFIASSALGVLSYSCMLTGRYVVATLRGRMFCSVTIHNRDENFKKVIDFIGKQGIVSSGSLVASTYQKAKTWKDWRTEFLMGQRTAPRMEYQPANNNDTHCIVYNGAKVLMHRAKGETIVTGWERTPTQMETLTLSSWGNDVAPLKRIIDDALVASFEELSDELTVFTLSETSWLGGWEKALSKKPRSIESVILDEDLANGLLADARSFLNSADWYADVGIPYRRGYLLYGPPGCGKTSFCQALAGALKLDLCMLTLSSKRLDDNALAACLRDAPANAIVLLEDVDAVFVDRNLAGENRNAGVTFSGLLNALDGVASQEGRLFFMTTNHIEKLDPALIRPGRCDVKVEVRRASRSQAARLYARFFEAEPPERALAFAESLPEYELSMAQLQGYLLEHKADAAGALAHVPRLLRTSKPKSIDSMAVFEHLRRVGLEGWASLFEHHGYSLRADLRGLGIDTVKTWSGFLRIDQRACKRLELLLTNDEALMAEYQLADMATVKEQFLSAFGADEPREPAAGKQEDEETASCASSASSLTDAIADAAEADASAAAPLSRLADGLCAAVQVDGKAAASIWQVRRHLHVYGHSPEACVAAAKVLVEPAPPCGVDAAAVDDLDTYGWLRRAGLETHATALEAKGYTTARSLYGLDEATLKDECGVKDKLELKVLKALTSADGAAARALHGFTAPDYARVRNAFLAAFSAADQRVVTDATLGLHASNFAAALCDRAGHGLVSLTQLERFLAPTSPYLARLGAGEADTSTAAAVAKAELVDHVRPIEPPAPEPSKPTEWVYGWLESHSLEKYAPKLVEHNFTAEDDLRLEPRLELIDLTNIGVDKARDARKLRELIKAL